MSVNFRISNRLSANSTAMRYMDRPPGPSSASRLSKALLNIEYDQSQGKSSFKSSKPQFQSNNKGKQN